MGGGAVDLLKSAMPRPAKSRNPQPLRSMYVAITGVEPGYVPKKWVKAWAGVFLVLPCVVLTLAFLRAFLRTAAGGGLLLEDPLVWFGAGGASALLWFFFFKPLVFLYVIGHEFSHAIWVWLHGGRVHEFEARMEGGHIVTDKTNTWIVLAPYVFPFYSVVWLAAYAVAVGGLGVPGDERVLFGGVGFTWVLHLAYTVWMIYKGQPDIEYGGTLFSLAFVYLANLAVISCLLVVGSSRVTWGCFGADLLHSAVEISALIAGLVGRVVARFE